MTLDVARKERESASAAGRAGGGALPAGTGTPRAPHSPYAAHDACRAACPAWHGSKCGCCAQGPSAGLLPMLAPWSAFVLWWQSRRGSVHLLVQVLDLWVDSFNPEFIERSMAGVIRDLMLALWAHIQPHPNPHGTKVSHSATWLWAIGLATRASMATWACCSITGSLHRGLTAGGRDHGQAGGPLTPVAAGGPQQRVQAHSRVWPPHHPGLFPPHVIPRPSGSLRTVCSSGHPAG